MTFESKAELFRQTDAAMERSLNRHAARNPSKTIKDIYCAALDAIFEMQPDYDGRCPGVDSGYDACPACGFENTRYHAVKQVPA